MSIVPSSACMFLLLKCINPSKPSSEVHSSTQLVLVCWDQTRASMPLFGLITQQHVQPTLEVDGFQEKMSCCKTGTQ